MTVLFPRKNTDGSFVVDICIVGNPDPDELSVWLREWVESNRARCGVHSGDDELSWDTNFESPPEVHGSAGAHDPRLLDESMPRARGRAIFTCRR